MIETTATPLFRRSELVAGIPGVRPERDAGLRRIRRGLYVPTVEKDGLSTDAAYLLRVRAVGTARPQAIVARESALAVHDTPFGLEPDAVFTIGGRGTAGTKAGVVHSQAGIDARDITTVAGIRVCTLAHALAEVARKCAVLDSVAAIDWALRMRKVTKAQIREALARQHRRGRARAEWAIGFADERAESVAESWSRVRVFQLGFAQPELQVWVTGPTGRRHRVDMCFRREGGRPVYGECDGEQKYGELANQQGRTGVQALAKEKERDDDLLFTGDPLHWVWADLLDPSRLERLLIAHNVPRPRQPVSDMSRTA